MRSGFLVMLWVSFAAGLRYDFNNFTDVASSGFEVMAYSDVPAVYSIPPPPGGVDSGGAFLFDSSGYHCMEIVTEKAPSLTVYISFWCDNNDPELTFYSCKIGETELYLCEGKARTWTETRLFHECSTWASNSKIRLCGNGLKADASVGYEYVEFYPGDYDKTTTTLTTTVPTTTSTTSMTTVPTTTTTTPTTTVPTTTTTIPTTTEAMTTTTTPTTTEPTTTSTTSTTTMPTTTTTTSTTTEPAITTTTTPTTTSTPTTTEPTTTTTTPTTTVPPTTTTTTPTTTESTTTTTTPTTTEPTTTSTPTTTEPTTTTTTSTTTKPTTTTTTPTTTVPTTTTTDISTTTTATSTTTTSTSTTTVPTTTTTIPTTTTTTTTSRTPTTTTNSLTSSSEETTTPLNTDDPSTTTITITTATPPGSGVSILGVSVFEFVALCLLCLVVLLVFLMCFLLLLFRRRKRRIYVKVVPHTPTSAMREHLHVPVQQPANTRDLIPRPLLRPSKSRQEERISHNGWVYGQDTGGGRRVDMGNIHTHSTSNRHYMDLDARPVHHGYGDVYSVTRNLEQRTGRGHSHQHAASPLWRVAPWAQGGYDWSGAWGNVNTKNKGVR